MRAEDDLGVLLFHPLTLVPDGRDVIVGRKDVDRYAAFPADGAQLLQQLRAGRSLREAAQWYLRRYGQVVDMPDFVATLQDLGIVRASDESAAPFQDPAWKGLGRAAFSWPAWMLYAGICGYAVFWMIRLPGLRPTPGNLILAPSPLLTELVLYGGQLPGIMFHEAMHALAGRRLGVATRLRLGNRLYIMVFETHLNGLWSVPRQARYLPLAAGMVGDLLWCSVLTVSAGLTWAYADQQGFLVALLRALAAGTLLRLAWQFCLYLQTDLYQIFVTALRCVDLHQTTREYLSNRVHRLLRRAAPYNEHRWHQRDRKVARWYAYLFGSGYLLTLGMLAWIGLPVAASLLTAAVRLVVTGSPLGTGFWDGCLTLILNGVPMMAVAVMVLRRRRAKRKATDAA